MLHIKTKLVTLTSAFALLLIFQLHAQIDPQIFSELEFRFIGPEGNRTIAISGVPGDPMINYVGFAEGGDIFRSKADVIVCDGFVGNVALKSAEGAARILSDAIQKFFSEHWYRKLLSRFMLPLLKPALKQLDPESHNGAIFLGLQGVLVKSHGAASSKAFERAIDLAYQEADADLVSLINDQLDQVLL